jgi:hypothetical protein
MPGAELVFNLAARNDPENWVHCKALFYGNLAAVANLNRGIDLKAEIDVATKLSADLQKLLVANVTGGADAAAMLQLEAAFPIDLFKEAGVIAQLTAEAEAAAWITAEVGLDIATLEQMARVKLSGIWLELLEIFLAELTVSAGIWAGVSFSAEAYGRAYLVGNLVETADGSSPGFTFEAGYGAGWGHGQGYEFIANLGLTDPARLLNRLSDEIATAMGQQLSALASSLPAGDAAAAQAALPYLELVLPLASRAAFEAGVALADSGGQSPGQATVAVMQSFARESQQWLLSKFTEVGLTAIKNYIQDHILPTVAPLGEPQLENVLAGITKARQQLQELDQAAPGEGEGWLEAAVGAADALMALLDTELIPKRAANKWREDVALLWSAAILVSTVVEWGTSVAAAGGDPAANPFEGSLPSLSASEEIEAYVRSHIKVAAGQTLALSDLVTFIAGAAGRLIELPEPEAAVLEWFKQTLGAGEDSELVSTLLVDLATVSSTEAESLAPIISGAIEEIVTHTIIPYLLEKLANAPDPEVQDMVNRVVRPSVLALATIVLPGVVAPQPDGEPVLREQISAVLLQFLTRFVSTTIDVLEKQGGSEASAYCESLATQLRSPAVQAQAQAALQSIVGVAAGSLLASVLDAEAAAEILDLSAEVITLCYEDEQTPVLGLIEELINFGLSTDADMQQLYTLASTPPAPSDEAAMAQLVVQVEDGTWKLLELVFRRGTEIIKNVLERAANELGQTIKKGAEEVFASIEQAFNELVKDVKELEEKLDKLVQEAQECFEGILRKVTELEEYLLGLQAKIETEIKAVGWNVILGLIDEAEKTLPWEGTQDLIDVANGFGAGIEPEYLKNTAEELAAAVYETLWAGMPSGVLQTPLAGLLEAIAGWIHDELDAELATGTLNPATVERKLRAWLLELTTSGIEIPVSFTIELGHHIPDMEVDLGAVTIPAGEMLNAIASTIVTDTGVGSWVSTLVQSFEELASLQALEPFYNQELGAAKGKEPAAGDPSALLGAGVAVKILSPIEGEVSAEANLDLLVSGANATFFENASGLPIRVRILLNGSEYGYSPASWQEQNDGYHLLATLHPSTMGLMPMPLRTGGVGPLTPIGSHGLVPWSGTLSYQPLTPAPGAGGSQAVVLKPGLNTIQLIAVDAAGDQQQESCVLFYLSPS